MDILDLLGSMMASPGTTTSRAIGAVIHHTNGALLTIAWAYGVALIGLPANWLTGLVWGAILTALALLMLSTMGRCIRRSGRESRKILVLRLPTSGR